MRPFSTGSVNVLAQYGAVAALKDKAAMAAAKQKTLAQREKTIKDLKALGYDVIPSQTNFFMVGLRREVQPVISAFRDEGVARRPSVPADDAAPARLGRPAGGDGSLHGRVQEDHGGAGHDDGRIEAVEGSPSPSKGRSHDRPFVCVRECRFAAPPLWVRGFAAVGSRSLRSRCRSRAVRRAVESA